VNRIEAVQHALEGRVKRVYLEIGVSRGWAFRRITADEKIAVDPAFKLSPRARRLADAKARATHYFETTSDAFFANETAFLEQHGIDVALIDGSTPIRRSCATSRTSCATCGTTASLSCTTATPRTPRSPAPRRRTPTFVRRSTGGGSSSGGAATSGRRSSTCAAPGTTCESRCWECDFGVGIIRKGFPESRLSYSAAQIEALNYSDLAADRDRLLNLKPPAYLGEFLALERRISRSSE
jgi:hypothetical protein